MVVVGLTSLFLGAILAQYFRVLILVPMTLIATGVVAAVNLGIGHAFFDAALAGGNAASALQLGYLLGLCVKNLVGQKQLEGVTRR